VADAIASNWIAPIGPDVEAFEAEVAARCGVSFGVGLSSGTAALHLALEGIGVGPGDEVVVQSLTFVPTANAVRYLGATPVFMDSDRETWCLSPELLADELAVRERQGTLPKAVIAVDLYGRCADYEGLSSILVAFGVALIEDAAEALGASIGGRPAGSFGAAAAMSFNGNKIITAGGSGGMLLTDDEALARRARFLAAQAKEPAAHYQHEEQGYNYGLSNLLAAFGRGQLATLDQRIARRAEIEARYAAFFADVEGVSMMPAMPSCRSNHWLTCIQVDPAVTGTTAEDIRVLLEGHDIESRRVWKPLHLQPLFADCQAVTDGTSERLFDEGLCLPSGSSMGDATIDRVLDALRLILRRG